MMKRLRRTLSFRSRSKYRANNNPTNWENDSINIKHGGLSFQAKYIGAVEVQESRGTQVCATAAHQLKMHPQEKKKRVTLWVTEDTIRVIDDVTKSLVVDQVIEKVSFCTPDPSDEKLFSYICRDGTTRRWMCHSFRGIKDTGERISHAVGCAFTACLQKKQQQNMKNDNFQRSASTRMSKLKEKGNANGIVLPQESVQQLQEINQQEYEERVKKAQEDQQIKTTANTSAASTGETNQLINGVPSPDAKKSANTFVRPRPTPGADPSPFTRHMSLPYRSKPLSHGFHPKGSSTYEALTDDLSGPRLHSESSSIESARATGNPGQPTSQADMWLATATTTPNQQGLLVTTVPNPFNTAAATTTVPGTVGSAGWNPNNVPAATIPVVPELKPNPFGVDNFQNNWSPTVTQAAQPNPFAVDFSNRQEQFV